MAANLNISPAENSSGRIQGRPTNIIGPLEQDQCGGGDTEEESDKGQFFVISKSRDIF
jgi:hypothetical protein